jgi:hypothetical protein
MTLLSPSLSGINEWAPSTANCCWGCSNRCRYCFSIFDNVARFGRLDEDACATERVCETEINIKEDGPSTVMFPTRHDITPANLDACLATIRKILDGGHRVLVVSKARLPCIAAICDAFGGDKGRMLIRITIGSDDDRILKAWEPGAPSFGERHACLRLVHERGFATSVSSEPMLDPPNIVRLVETLTPYVTQKIWIGLLKDGSCRVDLRSPEDVLLLCEHDALQRPREIQRVYDQLKDHPLIAWKESISEMLDLPASRDTW